MQGASAAEWASRVERWKDSGLTAKAFAAGEGLNASTLTYWSWRLRTGRSNGAQGSADKPKRPARTRAKEKAVARAQALPKLVELSVAEVVAAPPTLELVLQRDVRVRVPNGFDESTLIRLMRAVEGLV